MVSAPTQRWKAPWGGAAPKAELGVDAIFSPLAMKVENRWRQPRDAEVEHRLDWSLTYPSRFSASEDFMVDVGRHVRLLACRPPRTVDVRGSRR